MADVLRADRDTRSGWHGRADAAWAGATLLALWVIAIAVMGQVFAGPSWQWAAGAACVAALGIPVAWRVRRPAARLGACVAGALGAGAVAWWSVGTSGTWDLWRLDPRGAVQQIDVQIASSAPPVPASPLLDAALTALVALVGWLCAVLAFGAEAPMLATVPPLAMMLVPAMVTGQRLEPPVLLGIGAVMCCALWVTNPSRGSRGRGLTAMGVTLGVAALVGAGLPSTSERVWNPNAVIGSPISQTTPDVMVDLGADLTQPTQVEVFRYAAIPASDETRFVLADLVDFDAGTWKPLDQPDASAPVTRVRGAEGGATAPTRFGARRVQVQVSGLVSSWLPVPQGTRRVEPAPGSSWSADRWTWVQGTRTVRSTSRATRRGDAYVAWAVPAMDSLSLRHYARLTGDTGSLTPAASLARYTALPDGVPRDIVRTAQTVTAGASTRYDAAVDLVRYFRGGTFTYDTAAPVVQGGARDQFAMISAFLRNRSGYCVHFAAAFATMARAVGIPTRIAVGYAGAQSAPDDSRARAVSNRNLHAWPEVYIEGLGWIGFEPTPGGAGLDQAPLDEAASVPTPSTPTPATGGANSPGASEPTPSDSPTPDAATRGGEDAGSGAAATPAAARPSGWARAGLLVLVCALLAAAPALIRLALRLARLARIRWGRAPARAAWREAEDTAKDLALSPPPGAMASPTPRKLADALAGAAPRAGADLRTLAAAVTREVYAPASERQRSAQERDRLLGATRAAVSRMAASVPRGRRVRATLLPASLARKAPSRRAREGSPDPSGRP